MQKTVLDQLSFLLKHEKYQLVGRHSAVKKCRWLHQSLTAGRVCYKQKFYGIKSHRCLQMTPAVYSCLLRCLFCWRIQPRDIGLKVEVNETEALPPDSAKDIVNGCIDAQRRILSGYKAHSELSRTKYEEALNPAHAAISLTGEPTLYTHLNELIYEFKKRGMTTFLVTAGTVPKALRQLECEPDQLYLSLYASNNGNFNKVCRPQVSEAWQHINESLNLLQTFKCHTVLRLTAIKGLNMVNPEEYAKLIRTAESTYVEVKSYMYVGFSRRRLHYENMPTHSEIKAFTQKLTELTGYKVLDESVESRVILLGKFNKPHKIGS